MVRSARLYPLRHTDDNGPGVPVPAGLLYYSQSDSILRVEAKHNEIRAIIIVRNELANYLSQKRKVPEAGSVTATKPSDVEDAVFLPPTIDHPRECRSCYAVDSCMLYRKAGRRIHVRKVKLTSSIDYRPGVALN